MEVKELRIGNWVKSDVEGDIQVTVWDIISFSRKINKYSPILLTPEILKKAGALIYDQEKCYFVLCPLRGSDIGFKKIEGGFMLLGVHNPVIQHLHQLQNLYFVLTGDELGIQL